MHDNTALATVLLQYMHERGYSLQRLAAEANVAKQTLHHWSQGRIKRPHTWQPLVQVAVALGLTKVQATTLLQAAGYPSIDVLLERTADERDGALLATWATAPRHNLPSQLTSFLGRTAEISRITKLLEKARLVTFTGPGGAGKTRLALQVAANLLEAYPDGVWFVDLAPVHDPALVASTIAQVLAVQETADGSLLNNLQDDLRTKHLLLLLDNFEQVVAAAPQLVALLRAAPHLTVVVTSRVVLHVTGEYEFPVPPLPVPDPNSTFDVLTHNAAIALFAERAQMTTLDFRLTSANMSAVAEICARLEGLPLAIELVAARSKAFPPQAMLAHFPGRLDLASDGPQDVPPRYQTLREAIAWSYSLLDGGEQIVFRRLAVFVGGCIVEAAEVVCNVPGDLPLNVRDALHSLNDHSLLQQHVGRAGEPRFLMLETIREYAWEQLEASGEAEGVLRQHVHYYLALAEKAEPELYGPNQRIWRVRLESEHANFRAALSWLDTHAEVELGLRLASKLQEFWDRRGYVSEGREWLEKLLARSASPTGSPVAGSIRAEALLATGILADIQADYARAEAYYEESLALYRDLRNRLGIAEALAGLGRIAIHQGDLARAQAHWDECLAVYHRAIDNQAGITGLPNNLGSLVLQQGGYERARELLEESLVMYQERGSQWGMAMTCLDLGSVVLSQGEYRRARQLYKVSLALFSEQGNKRCIAYALEGLGIVHETEGQNAETARQAAALWAAAAALRQEVGAPLPVSERDEVEQAQTRARIRVDAATWTAAWAGGEALTLEQAIAYAMELETPVKQQG